MIENGYEPKSIHEDELRPHVKQETQAADPIASEIIEYLENKPDPNFVKGVGLLLRTFRSG